MSGKHTFAVLTIIPLALLNGCLGANGPEGDVVVDPEEHESLAADHASLLIKHALLLENHTGLLSEYELLLRNNSALIANNTESDLNLTILSAEFANLSVAWQDLNASNAALASSHSALQADLETLQGEHDSLQENHSVMQTEYGDLLASYQSLQAAHAALLSEARTCGTGTRGHGGFCIGDHLQVVPLPFPAGTEVSLGQAAHGYVSHNGQESFAIDFPAPNGTDIAAARAGRVLWVKEDSDEGCGNSSCANLSNYVVIDHGDATFGVYLHLLLNGSLVEVGETVERGQIIALVGDTGWATEPHLHFSVDDLYGQSLPLYIEELAGISEGVPFAGISVFSNNSRIVDDGDHSYSDCPDDAFIHMGVRLASSISCVVSGLDLVETLEGWVLSQDSILLVSQYDDVAGQWHYRCVATDSSGWFSTHLTWSSNDFSSDGWLMLASASPDCYAYQSWDDSFHISLR